MPFEQMIPRPLTQSAVASYAPAASGVYGVSNAREWIYIGETDDIRTTLFGLLKELSTSFPGSQPTGFVFEVCHRALCPARQDRLVLEYEPRCNRHPLRHL